MSVPGELDGHSPAQFRYAMLPDSADVRLFIELSGYANGDLSPALHALESALRLESSGDLDGHAPYLIEYGVVAYCRAFFDSKVRGRLTDHVSVPPQFVQLHEEVCVFRNRTVGHSQSEQSTTWPVAIIDQSGQAHVRSVVAVNVSQTLPLPHVGSLIALIETLIDAVDGILEPVRERLLDIARSRPVPDPSSMDPGFELQLDSAFDPRSHRGRYPTQQRLHVSQAPGPTRSSTNTERTQGHLQ